MNKREQAAFVRAYTIAKNQLEQLRAELLAAGEQLDQADRRERALRRRLSDAENAVESLGRLLPPETEPAEALETEPAEALEEGTRYRLTDDGRRHDPHSYDRPNFPMRHHRY